MGQSGVTAISLLLEISSLEVDRKKTARLWPPVVTSGHGGLASTYPRAKAMHQARMRIPASTGISAIRLSVRLPNLPSNANGVGSG